VEVYIHSFIFSALGGTEWSDLPPPPPPGQELAMGFGFQYGKEFLEARKTFCSCREWNRGLSILWPVVIKQPTTFKFLLIF